ncbi:hypothetical protein [Gemella morbillorum]
MKGKYTIEIYYKDAISQKLNVIEYKLTNEYFSYTYIKNDNKRYGIIHNLPDTISVINILENDIPLLLITF